jgi:very-short-patch-repair endonuclease
MRLDKDYFESMDWDGNEYRVYFDVENEFAMMDKARDLELPAEYAFNFVARHRIITKRVLMARRFPFIRKAVPTPARRTVLLVSPIEDAFWRTHQKLRLRPLNGLVRQYKVGQYRLDFALPRQMIGIELDGHRTHSSTQAIAADRKRQRWFEANGWYIIRFGGLEIYQDVDACVREAAELVKRHRR